MEESPMTIRKHGDDLRGAAKLAIEGTKGVTRVVEDMHRTIASGPRILGRPLAAPVRAILGLVYGPILGITGLVGDGIDLVLSQVAPLLGEGTPGPERDALVAALNGVLGDYLEETHNPLAIRMELRAEGRALSLESGALRDAIPNANGKLLVLVHGSSMNDRQWNRLGHDHGAALAKDLGFTPVYLRYNTGLHVSTNGRAFSGLLEDLVANWPVPVEEVTLLGHSMGGLVSRSACHIAEVENHRWRTKLRRLVFLGTPHHGSPLERGGNWVDVLLDISAYSAPLARLGHIRSAGVTDLRFGNVRDEDWQGRGRFARSADTRTAMALPKDVACYTIAGTTTHPMAERLLGDGLVPKDSALGRNAHPDRTLAFPEENQWVSTETGHLDLLNRQSVYDKLRAWLA
jgi:pimeloyl-ACP methyl ester carboxylesterase